MEKLPEMATFSKMPGLILGKMKKPTLEGRGEIMGYDNEGSFWLQPSENSC